MLEHIPNRRPGTNHLSEMRAHISGDAAFVRGLATLVDASEKVIARCVSRTSSSIEMAAGRRLQDRKRFSDRPADKCER